MLPTSFPFENCRTLAGWFETAHLAVNVPEDVCGNFLDDRLGARGTYSWGGIDSPGTFDQWFRDVLGTNLSAQHAFVMIPDDDGVYEYSNDEFYPIDNMLLGNEGDPHNYYFTYQMRAEFTYEACSGQFFEFMGADDAWLFVDGDLVIDLGGLQPMTWQRIDMDRLHLVDGESYPLELFYAHRTQASVFWMRTNVTVGTDVGTISAPFD